MISIISKSRSGDPHDVIFDRCRGKVEDEMIIEKESGWVDRWKDRWEVEWIPRNLAPSKNAKASVGWPVGSTEQLPWLVPRNGAPSRAPKVA